MKQYSECNDFFRLEECVLAFCENIFVAHHLFSSHEIGPPSNMMLTFCLSI